MMLGPRTKVKNRSVIKGKRCLFKLTVGVELFWQGSVEGSVERTKRIYRGRGNKDRPDSYVIGSIPFFHYLKCLGSLQYLVREAKGCNSDLNLEPTI